LRDREKGRFNIDGAWFQFGRKQGISSAEKEKLLAPEISLGGNFVYDENGQFYSTTTIYGFVKKIDTEESYKCLMAILNSQLFWWYLTNTGTVLANGYFRYKPNYIKPFPVPLSISKEILNLLEHLVDEIMTIKYPSPQNDCYELENKINDIIYDLYKLNQEEIAWIKKSQPI
jgi:hypothetical protein